MRTYYSGPFEAYSRSDRIPVVRVVVVLVLVRRAPLGWVLQAFIGPWFRGCVSG